MPSRMDTAIAAALAFHVPVLCRWSYDIEIAFRRTMKRTCEKRTLVMKKGTCAGICSSVSQALSRPRFRVRASARMHSDIGKLGTVHPVPDEALISMEFILRVDTCPYPGLYCNTSVSEI